MKNISIAILILILIVLAGGFLILMDEIRSVRQEIKNLSINTELFLNRANQIPEPITPKIQPNSSKDEEERLNEQSINTAILFKTESSPLLSPQAILTVSVEKVSKTTEGILSIKIKVFTTEAKSYSSLEPGNLFELVNLKGENQKPLKVRGQFDSMPPESAVSGEVIFKVPADQYKIILQISTDKGIKYYQFNFQTLSYEEAILG